MNDKAAYLREYYGKNKDRLLVLQRERNRKHYLANKEYHRKKTLRWMAEHPERARELQKRYQERNREKLIQRSAEWYRKNRPRAAISARKAKLKRYGLTPEQFQMMAN